MNSSNRFRSLVFALAALLVTSAVPAPAPAQTPLVEVVFGVLNPTAAEWPLYIAQEQGYFKDEGLKITVVNGGSPQNVINLLATNAVNMASDGTDSVMAAISRGLAIKMVAPIFTVNPYSLVVASSINSWSDLKGKSVELGTKQDVTAIAFAKLAERQKMKIDDFSIVIGGNSVARYAALTSGNVQGAMLAQPFDIEAQSKGFKVLGTASDVIKNWSFTSVNINVAWGEKNRPLAVKVLRAMRRAVQYGYKNKEGAVAALVAEAKIDPVIAAKAYDIDFTKWKAFDPNMKLSQSDVEAVAKAQMEFGVLTAIPKWTDVYDGSYIAEATK